MSHCFRNSSLTTIWNDLGLPNYNRMDRNLEFRKKNVFYETLFNKRSAKCFPRTMEWLRGTTNASEQEDSLLNKGLNNSFLNYNKCLF